MSDPYLGEVDPADDPTGFLKNLLNRYFRPGLVDSVIRTWVPVGLGSALSWVGLNYSWLGLPAKPSATLSLLVTGGVIAAYYLAARVVERRFPRVGRWLVALNLTRSKPLYTEASTHQVAAVAAAQTRSTTQTRSSPQRQHRSF